MWIHELPANASLYVPRPLVRLRSDASLRGPDARNRRGQHYELSVGGSAVRLNIMPTEMVAAHLRGFAGWVQSLDEPHDLKAEAHALIKSAQHVLGLVTGDTFENNPALMPWLFGEAEENGAFVFMLDSIYLASGVVLIGAMRRRPH